MSTILALSLLLAGQTTQPAIPAEWQRQLDELAKEVERDLSVPATRNGECLQTESRLVSALLLASVWPRPEFRPHLLRVLACNDPGLIQCAAAALLGYDDPSLRERVASMQTDTRGSGGGCFGSTVGRDIQLIIARHWPATDFVVPPRGLLLRDAYESFQTNLVCTTVPRAAAALRDPRLSIRFQAFCWLDAHGIVLDLTPLREAWPLLSDLEREPALNRFAGAPRVGRDVLRAEFERLLERSDKTAPRDYEIVTLLSRLAQMNSRAAHAFSLRLIARLHREGGLQDGIACPQLLAAFAAVAASATADDIPTALEWTQSKRDFYFRYGGYCVLACIDDQRACDAVISCLDHDMLPAVLDEPWGAFLRRDWPDLKYKFRYLRGLSAALTRAVDNERFDESLRREKVTHLVRSLEALAGQSKGRDGLSIPDLKINRDVARQTAANWAEWVRIHNPAR